MIVVLWAGSLWSLAAWVAPTLFRAQDDRHLAGILAARLFGIETYVGLGAAVLMLSASARKRYAWGYVAAALPAIDEWLLKPVMALAHEHGRVAGLTFGAWHGVAALVYLAACFAAAVLVWNEDFR
jgi:hypothetical protein